MNRILILKFSCLTLSLLLLQGCGKQNPGESYQQQAPELPVATVVKGNAIIEKEYSASIEGRSNVEIRPQVSGYLEKINVDEGAYVKAGQVLFIVDGRTYLEQYKTAKANLLTAKIDLDRKKELVKSKIISNVQFQQAEAAYQAAASVAETAKINYGFCSIKAPVSGYIGRINYRLGSLVSAANPTAITFLSDISQVNVYFAMSENDFINFKQQYPGRTTDETLKKLPNVDLLLSNGTPYDVSGKIDALEGQFNRNTGSITLRAKFDNPKTLLRSGNTGRIRIKQNFSDVILFPIASTISIQDKLYVFTVDNKNKALQVPVTIAGKAGNDYIISSGINAGDKYVREGFERLQSGTVITVQNSNNSKKPN